MPGPRRSSPQLQNLADVHNEPATSFCGLLHRVITHDQLMLGGGCVVVVEDHRCSHHDVVYMSPVRRRHICVLIAGGHVDAPRRGAN